MAWMRFYVLLFCILVSSSFGFASTKDPRLVHITKEQMVSAVARIPPTSQQHVRLLSRAHRWRLSKEAYNRYALLLKKSPKSAYANLFYGLSARYYMDEITDPSYSSNLDKAAQRKAGQLQQEARKYLSKAFELNPSSPLVN